MSDVATAVRAQFKNLKTTAHRVTSAAIAENTQTGRASIEGIPFGIGIAAGRQCRASGAVSPDIKTKGADIQPPNIRIDTKVRRVGGDISLSLPDVISGLADQQDQIRLTVSNIGNKEHASDESNI